MARGRFITNGITSDKKINDLSDDTSRLAFTWLITFADCEGRTHGDPAMVRSLLFPRRSDVTNERMEAYIAEWQAAGLVRVYASNGDMWIDFPNFNKHQTGLRKDHEAASTIPPFEDGTTTELLRSKDVVETPQIKYKRSKVNISGEEKAPRQPDPLFDAIAKVTCTDPATAGASIGKIESTLKKATPPYTSEEVLQFGSDWPAWKDKPPTLWQLKEQIGIVRQNGHKAEPAKKVDWL
jgi:hypothetical protein